MDEKSKKRDEIPCKGSYSTISIIATGKVQLSNGSIPSLSFLYLGCETSYCQSAFWMSSLNSKSVGYLGWYTGSIDPSPTNDVTSDPSLFQRPALQ